MDPQKPEEVRFGSTKRLYVLTKQCRSVLELAIPARSPGLPNKEAKHVDTGIKEKAIVFNIWKKALKSEKYSAWFCYSEKYTPKVNTRYSKTKTVTKLKPVTTRTRRYRHSPLPYLTNLLNQHFEEKSRN